MMGTGGGTSSGTSGLNSLYDVVSLLGDDVKYSEKIKELTAKVMAAEQALTQADSTHREASAVRAVANEMLASAEAKFKQLAKERTDFAIAFEDFAQKQREFEHQVLNSKKDLAEREAALEADKRGVVVAWKKHQEDVKHREQELAKREAETLAKLEEAKVKTHASRTEILAQANKELQREQEARKEAEAKLLEAEALRQEHENRLHKLLDLASGHEETVSHDGD